MFLLSGHLFHLAWAAKDRADAQQGANPTAFTEDTSVAIILAAASTEAFINELAELSSTPQLPGDQLVPELLSFEKAWREIEANRGSIRLKYLVASQLLSGRMFDKGAGPYQDWAMLLELRDRHMHLKAQSIESAGSDSGLGPVVRHPDPVRQLQQRGIARANSREVISWMQALQTSKVADWACRSALGIIDAVLEMVPESTGFADATLPLKLLFHSAPGIPKPWR